jgi:positive regulator of sigma E activity
MEPQAISETLQEIDTLRRETRSALQSFWFPLVLFGALTLVAAPLCRVDDGAALGLFWALAGPAGAIAVGAFYARRDNDIGLSRPAWPYILAAIGLMAGAFLLPLFTSGHLQEVVSTFAVAAGYLGFAVIERDARLAGVAAVLAAVPLVVLAVAPEVACTATAAATGSVLLASGLSFRRTQLQPTAP